MYYAYRFRNQPENTDCHNLLIYQDDERCYEQKDPVCINILFSKYKSFIWISQNPGPWTFQISKYWEKFYQLHAAQR